MLEILREAVIPAWQKDILISRRGDLKLYSGSLLLCKDTAGSMPGSL